MAVQFVPKTHYIFSAGKDGVLKYWDADKFELLLTLEGHHAEVWCLAVSPHGDFVVTGSHDRSIRRWDRTEEPFFIEEEREKRLESMFEAVQDDSKDESLQQTTEVGAKRTQESLTAADSIIEALDMAEEEIERMRLHKVGFSSLFCRKLFQGGVVMFEACVRVDAHMLSVMCRQNQAMGS
jgi:U3 small nucleolar RNA-associated protein 12